MENLKKTDGHNSSQRTMTSLVIARITGKQHKNVMRDIRNMEAAWEKVTGLKFELSDYTDKTGRKLPCYTLKYDECMYVAAKWEDETRAKLVRRWRELELQRIAEEQNPEISVNKAVDAYRKQGRTDSWIANRLAGMAQRSVYTKVLHDHDVRRFGSCTDAVYIGLFGKRARELKKIKELPEKANLRDSMDMVQLSSIMLSEALASENIEHNNVRGDTDCIQVSKVSGLNVRKAVMEGRRQLRTI